MATIKELLGDKYKDSMTIAEVEEALNGVNLGNLSSGDYVAKGKLSDMQKRAEQAEKSLRERMSDDEKREQAENEREAHYAELERKYNIAQFREQLGKTITDESTLSQLAELYADGKITEAVALQTKHYYKAKTEMEKRIRLELLQNQPEAQAQSSGDTTMTKEQFRAMSLFDKQELATKDPETYKKLTTE